jgi:hypothetical protein
MQTNDGPVLADSAQIRYHLDQLSAIEASDAPVLSCYLDVQAGRQACLRFLDEQAERLRGSLRGAARMDVETALETIRSEVARHWHPQAKGLALFARSLAGGQVASTIATAVALDMRLTTYRVPYLLPLVDVLAREAPYTLILARRGAGIQVLDLDAGISVPRAWLALPGALDRMPAESGIRDRRWGRKRHVTLAEGYSRFARRVLAAQAARPIVIAGDADIVAEVSAWLPQRSRHRLLEQLEVPGHLFDQEALDYVRERMQKSYAQRTDALAQRVVRAALGAKPAAVAGVEGSFDMLRTGLVRNLLVSRRQGCEEQHDQASVAVEGAAHAEPAPASGRSLVELVRMAVQRGVPVVVGDAKALRENGGVACLLTETTESQLMPEPTLPRRLDLVA